MAGTSASHQSSREVYAASIDHRLSALRTNSTGLDLEKRDGRLDDFERPLEARGSHVAQFGPIGSARPYFGCLYHSVYVPGFLVGGIPTRPPTGQSTG